MRKNRERAEALMEAVAAKSRDVAVREIEAELAAAGADGAGPLVRSLREVRARIVDHDEAPRRQGAFPACGQEFPQTLDLLDAIIATLKAE